jgi:DNA-binding LacI/PurR family transcriptional regulator
MASFKDIAQQASVSVATVSHVVNKTRTVSNQLTARVEAAMEALNYQPNLIARSLRKKQTMTIGLIVPDISSYVFYQLAKTVEDTFAKLDYHVILCNSSWNSRLEDENIRTLLSKRVDGIMVAPASPQIDHLVSFRRKNLLPMVLVVSIAGIREIDNVYANERKAGYMAAEHLISLGHREIAYLDRHIDHTYSVQRRDGFSNALQDNNIEVLEDFIIRCDSIGFDGGYKAVRKIVAGHRRPSAIVCYNDTVAIGGLSACFEADWRVPRDISIVGIDNMEICPFLLPPLTTVDYPLHEIGQSASELLFERISNEASVNDSREMMFPPKLVIRSSTSSILTVSSKKKTANM